MPKTKNNKQQNECDRMTAKTVKKKHNNFSNSNHGMWLRIHSKRRRRGKNNKMQIIDTIFDCYEVMMITKMMKQSSKSAWLKE